MCYRFFRELSNFIYSFSVPVTIRRYVYFRDYHLDSIFSSMENIMVLVLEESEEISVEMLKPLLASVKKDSEVLGL